MIPCRITASASNGSPYLSKITSAMAQLTCGQSSGWPASFARLYRSKFSLAKHGRHTKIAAAFRGIETHLLVAVSAVRAVAIRIDIAHRADLFEVPRPQFSRLGPLHTL